jgi:hypothetical protein
MPHLMRSVLASSVRVVRISRGAARFGYILVWLWPHLCWLDHQYCV